MFMPSTIVTMVRRECLQCHMVGQQNIFVGERPIDRKLMPSPLVTMVTIERLQCHMVAQTTICVCEYALCRTHAILCRNNDVPAWQHCHVFIPSTIVTMVTMECLQCDMVVTTAICVCACKCTNWVHIGSTHVSACPHSQLFIQSTDVTTVIMECVQCRCMETYKDICR